MLFDTHTHINAEEFKDDLEDVMDRAKHAGIEAMVVVGFDRPSMEGVRPLIERYDQVYGAVGWNPVDAVDMTDKDLERIEELLNHPKMVALGEIGLDYHWDKSPKQVQKDVLKRQIHLARKLGLPIIIHNREATEDTIAVLREEHAEEVGGVMHCYSDNWAWARKCIALNFYISFGGPLTFKNAPLVRETAAQVPLDRLLIETDCPYLSPHPFRGKRNEPARVKLVAEKLAEVKGLSYDEIARITFENAKRCFHIE